MDQYDGKKDGRRHRYHDRFIINEAWDFNILVFELMDTTLYAYILYFQNLESLLIKSYMFQILLAVRFIHSLDRVHLDIKTPNLLLDKAGLCKLADFGKV